MDKIDALESAGGHHAEVPLLQEDLGDIKAGRPAKPAARAPKAKAHPKR